MVQLAPFRQRFAGQKVANCTMPLSNALGDRYMECISINPIVAICVLLFFIASPLPALLSGGYWAGKNERILFREKIIGYHRELSKRNLRSSLYIVGYPVAMPFLAAVAYPLVTMVSVVAIGILAISVQSALCT